MAFNLMVRQNNDDYKTNVRNKIYFYRESIATPSNGNPIIIPDDVRELLVRFIPTAGSGSIETSVSSIDSIKGVSGAPTAVWNPWDAGTVAALTDDTGRRVNAVRLVNTSGTTVIEMIAY